MSQAAPYILLDDQITHELRYYTQPIDIVEAHEPGAVETALAKLKEYHAQGYYLAGYLSYDLGFALENGMDRFCNLVCLSLSQTMPPLKIYIRPKLLI